MSSKIESTPELLPPTYGKMRKHLALALLAALTAAPAAAGQQAEIPEGFTRQDVLRGSITPEREWWDLQHYLLDVQVFPDSKTLKGSTTRTVRTLAAGDRMQVDLQEPLGVTKVMHGDTELAFEREGSVYWIQFPEALPAEVDDMIQVFYEGTPVESENPPWSGGLTWQQDDKGNPFIATTCQGIGASVWWPNRDHLADEPDRGVDIRVTVPRGLTAVANGRLIEETSDKKAKTTTFLWRVTKPINNYCVNVNIGNYVSWKDTYKGEHGELDLEYWVLEGQEKEAKEQFKQLPMTLEAFEHWFGKYPFYEDSYKLVVVPYLGMEHQSSVTYGNEFKNGYRGRDLSRTGVGLKFDYIIIHEAAHEWWGNNVSKKDPADMWIHESFGTYAESIYVEYHFGKEDAATYVIGTRRGIRNDKPIIGQYGLNNRGSSDMYSKGANILHTMRHMLDDDDKWLAMLRGIQSEFWHQTVTTAQVEGYINKVTGFDFGLVFDQYLRTKDIPLLRWSADGKELTVWFERVVPGFAAPVVLELNGKPQRVVVSDQPSVVELKSRVKSLELDRNFYMDVQGE